MTFDLDAAALNEVPLGARCEALSFLGPAENPEATRSGGYHYYSLGLSIECDADNDLISCIEIVARDPSEPRFKSFPGCVVANGRALDCKTLTESVFTDVFGEPFWVDRDDEESILFYEFPKREWQVEFDLQSRFNRIVMTNDPLLADQEQRKAYAVTKFWPP